MAHELEIVNGEASMVYQGDTPWHRLGTKVDSTLTADEMLRKANADYDVELLPVFYMDADGVPQEMEERFITSRVNHDGTIVPFEVVKGRYNVVNNRPVYEKALSIIDAAEGMDTKAIVETVGVLKEGREFFASIDLGSLIIDPLGASDKIARYLLVHTSHDGTSPISYSNTDIRAVCANTVRFGQAMARSVFKARHTPNVEATLQEARQQLEFSLAWADAFKLEAEKLLAIPVPVGSGKVDTVLNGLWNPLDADTDRKERNRQAIIDDIRARYTSDKNVGKVGANGWALYNAIVEHHDHGSRGSSEKRAMASMSPTSLVTQRKFDAQVAVLALA
jgi:phage/plasmid-like protein (TIGR03299 family)